MHYQQRLINMRSRATAAVLYMAAMGAPRAIRYQKSLYNE